MTPGPESVEADASLEWLRRESQGLPDSDADESVVSGHPDELPLETSPHGSGDGLICLRETQLIAVFLAHRLCTGTYRAYPRAGARRRLIDCPPISEAPSGCLITQGRSPYSSSRRHREAPLRMRGRSRMRRWCRMQRRGRCGFGFACVPAAA